MARGNRRWGLLCPDDGGILLEHPDFGDRVWCPSNGHGGNGRFFAPAEVQEGWEDPVAGASAGLTAKQERQLKNKQADAVRAAARESIDEAEAPDVPKRKERRVTAEKPARETTPGQRSPRDCECGCGGQTKGGRFLPGHDAKLHARQKAEAKAAAEAAAAGIQ